MSENQIMTCTVTNENDDFIYRLGLLDSYMLSHICKYIPYDVRAWLNKTNYISNHKYVSCLVKKKQLYDSYLRNIIRNDMSFVFDTIMQQDYNRYWDIKKYVYKKKSYRSYSEFLDKFIFENNSHRCRDVLFNNVYRKKYRKIRNNISWRH